MVRATFTITSFALILAGSGTAYAASPDSQAAKEFATQKDVVCCFVGMKSLDVIPDKTAAKAPQYPDLSGQLADANRNLADKERENADLARQLAESKAGQNPDRSGEVAALTAANADLAQQLAALRSVTLRGIFFDTGKSTIKPEFEKDLDALGRALNSDPSLKLTIQGHTDSVGGKDYNLQLSKSRADAVKKYVVENYGIAADRLSTAGYGETTPAADNTTPAGRAQNRRVEMVKTTGDGKTTPVADNTTPAGQTQNRRAKLISQ